jgi:hypothetical protein
MVEIVKGKNEAVANGFNFTHSELHPNSNLNLSDQVLPDIIYLTDEVVNSIQAIRFFYNQPIRINGTARTKEFQSGLKGGATNSKHLSLAPNYLSSAIDWAFVNDSDKKFHLDYHNQILNNGPLKEHLISIGLMGFGLYDNFNHIDGGQREQLAIWDKRVSTKGENSYLENFVGNLSVIASASQDEDGIEDTKQGLKNNGLMILILVACFWILVRK